MALDAGDGAAFRHAASHASGRARPYEAGHYSNFTEERGGAGRFFAGETVGRLQAVKGEYDPENLFHANHPVK